MNMAKKARKPKPPKIYTETFSPFQAAVESLFCTSRGTLRRGTEKGMTSRNVREILAKDWLRQFKDETTYEQRVSAALSGLQRRLLLIRHKSPAIFGYFRHEGTPLWYVAKYPERPGEVLDIINIYNSRSDRALHTIALIEAVQEHIDKLKG
jgi:hypothetical protein